MDNELITGVENIFFSNLSSCTKIMTIIINDTLHNFEQDINSLIKYGNSRR